MKSSSVTGIAEEPGLRTDSFPTESIIMDTTQQVLNSFIQMETEAPYYLY